MAFTKVTDPVDNITTQPNKPIIGATALKALFDEIGKDLKTYINDTLTVELESATNGNSGADNIGLTPVEDINGNTVQGFAEGVRELIKSIEIVNSNAEVVVARKGEPTLGDKIDEIDLKISDISSELPLKADISYVDLQISAVADGSPKGTYATLVALESAFPTGTTGIYVVTADGKWYYWNGSAWTAGGVYQSTGLGENAVDYKNLVSEINEKVVVINEYKINANTIGIGNSANGATANTVAKTITIPNGSNGRGSFLRYSNGTYRFTKEMSGKLWFKISVNNITGLVFDALLRTDRAGVTTTLTAIDSLGIIPLGTGVYIVGAEYSMLSGDYGLTCTLQISTSSAVVTENVTISVLEQFVSVDAFEKIDADRKTNADTGRVVFDSVRNYRVRSQHPTDYISLVGIDTSGATPVYYGVNLTQGTVHQKTGVEGAWSTNKGFPTNVVASGFRKVVKFLTHLYVTALDTNDNVWKVYRALPTAGANDAFVWSAALISGSSGSTFTLPTVFNASSNRLYLGEYGYPTAGPAIYRTTDGTNWSTVRAADPTIDHIHGINADTYRPGWVWATTGDTVNCGILLSKDNGINWTAVAIDQELKSVQISFSPNYVWLASDSLYGSTVFCVDRDNLNVFSPSWNVHRAIAVPGGASGDEFYNMAFIGCADPNNETYYCVANDTSVPGNTNGLFMLNQVGGFLSLVSDEVPLQTMGSNFPQVYVSEGYVFCGNYFSKVFQKK